MRAKRLAGRTGFGTKRPGFDNVYYSTKIQIAEMHIP